jgi:serine/threonine-protein kinase
VLTAPAAVEAAAPAAAAEGPGLAFQMEAWMPEAIAIMKLRGFVHDHGGEVVESNQGLVRVRLGRSSAASAAMGWLGLRRSGGPLDVELHLGRPAGDRGDSAKQGIRVVFRPAHPGLLGDEAWRERCSQAFVELRAYLMGGG